MWDMAIMLEIPARRSSMENWICHPGAAQDGPAWRAVSGGETEMHHVAVGDDIILAFEAQFSRLARAGFAVHGDVIVIGNRLGADETLLELGMDDAGRARRAGAAGDRPGARFLRPGGEIGDEMEEGVAGADQPVETGLLEADGGEIVGALGGGQHRDLRLDLGGNDHGGRVFALRLRLDPLREYVAA